MTSTPPSFMHDMADFVSRLNQNLVKSDASRALSIVERQTLATLHHLVYERSATFYNEITLRHDATLGIMTSGGTLSNLTGLWCARNACFPPVAAFKGVEDDGLAEALRVHHGTREVIVGSPLMHYSIEKAAAAELAFLIEESADFELLHRPQTDTVLYRHVPARLQHAVAAGTLQPDDQRALNAVNEALQRAQYDIGARFVPRTMISDLQRYPDVPLVALRAVVGHPFIDTEDMKALLDEQRIVAATPEAECQPAC